MQNEFSFKNLPNADLVVDAIYKGGTHKNIGDEPLHHLFPKCGTSGGFRKVSRAEDKSKIAYVVLYTSMSELEWPDYLDEETGIFRYYGDNRLPGHTLTETKLGGNKLLEEIFSRLNSSAPYDDIPPFFIFKKEASGRDMRFLGLAAPGNPKLSSDNDLIAFWRTIGDARFQNYEAYFTILDTGKEAIPRQWLNDLLYDHANSLKSAPDAWKKFIKRGRKGITPLKAPRLNSIPKKYDQLQTDEEGRSCLYLIREHYSDFPQGFEACAIELVQMMDHNFVNFDLTRPWRDGGRDAIGYYKISSKGKANYPLRIDCALEAKCYAENHSVGVKQMSRLISRIRYRQFGIMITTSFVNKQAYKEVINDGHPILILTANDVASILRSNSIYSNNINDWLNVIDKKNSDR